jgi:hypothetical protein
MALTYHDLDDATRQLMLQEVAVDVMNGTIQISKWLTPVGRNYWVELLRSAIQSGDDVALACELRRGGYLRLYQVCHRNGRPYQARVPHTAADTLAEGDFNHYYCRAVCRRSFEEGKVFVEVYRAKAVSEPRPRSQQVLGTLVDAHQLLHDLRAHPGGIDAALGIPAGPNSGLSVRLPKHVAGHESVA